MPKRNIPNPSKIRGSFKTPALHINIDGKSTTLQNKYVTYLEGYNKARLFIVSIIPIYPSIVKIITFTT